MVFVIVESRECAVNDGVVSCGEERGKLGNFIKPPCLYDNSVDLRRANEKLLVTLSSKLSFCASN